MSNLCVIICHLLYSCNSIHVRPKWIVHLNLAVLITGETLDVNTTCSRDASVWCVGLRSLLAAGSATGAAKTWRRCAAQFRWQTACMRVAAFRRASRTQLGTTDATEASNIVRIAPRIAPPRRQLQSGSESESESSNAAFSRGRGGVGGSSVDGVGSDKGGSSSGTMEDMFAKAEKFLQGMDDDI